MSEGEFQKQLGVVMRFIDATKGKPHWDEQLQLLQETDIKWFSALIEDAKKEFLACNDKEDCKNWFLKWFGK